MAKAYFNSTKEILEAESFKNLFKGAILNMQFNTLNGDLGTADIEVDGVHKYSLVPTRFSLGGDIWYTIDVVRHRDGEILTVRKMGWW